MKLDENTLMELIIYAGEARSDAMAALRAAREHDWGKMDQMLNSASVAARKAHQIQTSLISADEGCGKIPVNLILAHAQDHLMNAILCRDLVEELVYLHREIADLKRG
ncbi:PTS system cellobiose-specific IIA component|uniref:PTS system cellobiose-specific IIA component n=1 Tax=Brenneria salicis ATCC 15712 = DSM 30166 TaxID=714314 RepID=A0A366I8S7_9GAMM|nr:PTS lactose/cellobiose transporter subunit IIA [Brenneria salicis]NMN89981.1 PTS system cellobiose-specific IIA component [Brenneria salicis ATCC 15712 = DSM 30166]RBP64375.1 PTS system cellobiose-specific IIA component [Brenneria salicis ATCC 15712 = DSM 30166]RLM31408.1 molecular chaperone TorD [Brenneria salicis ATCC 15712 = DSM 30166]